MANIILKIDDRLLKRVRNIARKRKISLDAVVDQKLKEFVSSHRKKETSLAGLEAFFRKSQARVGQITWRRDELHEREGLSRYKHLHLCHRQFALGKLQKGKSKRVDP